MFDSIYSLVYTDKEVFGTVTLNQFLFMAAVAQLGQRAPVVCKSEIRLQPFDQRHTYTFP